MTLEVVMSNKSKTSSLTAKQELFCKEYLKDLNATKAAIRSNYSQKTAQQQGSENLSKPVIQQRIAELNQERLTRVQIDADFVLGELHKIANADINDAYNEDGSLKPISEIPTHLRKCIASLETVEYFEGSGEDREHVGWVRKIRFWSKDKSLENLGRHLKLFTDKVEHGVNKSLEDILTESFSNE
jgi:phage terminase small subunit